MNDMPNPLTKVLPDASLRIYSNALKERPELAALIMQVIGIWSSIDTWLARVLCGLLKSDFRQVIAMYNEIVSSNTRDDMLIAAAEISLEKDQELLSLIKLAIRRIKTSSRNKRHSFAHHLWVICPELEDAVCLIDPNNFTQYHASVFEYEKTPQLRGLLENAFPVEEPSINYDDVDVYKKADLEREIEAARKALEIVLRIYFCFHGRAVAESRSELKKLLGISE